MTTQPYAPPARPSNGSDVAASTVALVVSALVAGLGCLWAFMSIAFASGCTGSCDPDVLVRNAMLMMAAALVIGLAGLVITVVRLGRRQLAWPFALATLLLLVAVFVVGFVVQLTM